MTLEVTMPKDLYAALGFSRARATEQLKEFSVLGLYQGRRISAGKAAEMLDMQKAEFIRLLARAGVPYFDYSAEELADEFLVVDQWEQRHD
jgi:predicted HTH domain antitoxin